LSLEHDNTAASGFFGIVFNYRLACITANNKAIQLMAVRDNVGREIKRLKDTNTVLEDCDTVATRAEFRAALMYSYRPSSAGEKHCDGQAGNASPGDFCNGH
jgi:hypothetical protein